MLQLRMPFRREKAAVGYRPELDPLAWAYLQGHITPAQLEREVGDVNRKAAIVQFSPPDEWRGLDEQGRLIVAPAWRRRYH